MIQCKSLEKRYGPFQALHPLDLHVRKGEVFGFLGPNGAGKTTTIRTLAGVITTTSGQVFIDGMDIMEHPVESKRKVGYIPDRPYLYDKLTAREFLQFVGQLYGLSKAHIKQRGDGLLEENEISTRKRIVSFSIEGNNLSSVGDDFFSVDGKSGTPFSETAKDLIKQLFYYYSKDNLIHLICELLKFPTRNHLLHHISTKPFYLYLW